MESAVAQTMLVGTIDCLSTAISIRIQHLDMKNQTTHKSMFQRASLMTAFVAGLLLTACVPQKKVVLLQDKTGDNKTTFAPMEHITDRYLLQPNDYLFVRVTTLDPKLSVFYNPALGGATTSTNQAESKFYYYLIDDSMNINFPYVGKINLADCNLVMAEQRIRDAISAQLQNFTLVVRLASNSISVLGEVNKTGQYTMTRDQMTIWDAVSMAGGFTSYARRSEVQVVRRDKEGTATIHTLDLTDRNIINSEYYYIYPNDVIYVSPLRVKMFGLGESLSPITMISVVSSLVTLYLLFKSL